MVRSVAVALDRDGKPSSLGWVGLGCGVTKEYPRVTERDILLSPIAKFGDPPQFTYTIIGSIEV